MRRFIATPRAGARPLERKSTLDGTAVGLMVLLSALWGFQQVTIKLANTVLPPFLQCGLRSGLAVVLVGLWARARGMRLALDDGSLVPGLIAGLLFAAEFSMIYLGLNYTTAARSVLLIYCAPFVVAVGVHYLVPGEELGRWQSAGLICAFVGVAAAFSDNLTMPSGDQWIGDLCAFSAAIGWGATTLVIRTTRLARVPAAKTLIYQLGVSALVLPLVSWGLGEHLRGEPTALVWAAFAYQTVVVAFASYLVWFWLIISYPPARLSAFSFLTPLFGMLFGTLLLGEPITPLLALGMALVCAGLWMINRKTAA